MRRWRLLLPVALVALGAPAAERAEGKPRAGAPGRRPAEHRTLWHRVTDPNGDLVRSVLAKARVSMRRADEAREADEEWAIDQRTRFYRDAYRLAAHARTLAPDHLDALAVFARAAEELGRTTEAIEALERSVGLTGPDKAAREVVSRLGSLYLRRGEADRAIRLLRRAQGPVTLLGTGLDDAYAMVHLATALADRGEVAAALHALESSLPKVPSGLASDEIAVLTFALAVLYDRDEQRAAAFEVLDRLRRALGDQYLTQLQLELVRMRFQPPEDLHYYRALLYESANRYVEARAEWALYAAAGQPAYRARALDHIAAIDAQRRATPGPKLPQQGAPPRAIPRRLRGP